MIKAKVRYTEKHYKQLMNHGSMLALKIFIFASFVAIELLGGFLLLEKLLGADDSIVRSLIIITLGFYLIIHFSSLPKIMVKRHFQQFPDSEEYYSFGEDGFTELTKGPGLNHEQSITYDRFISCYENREWFILFLTRNSAYIIHKSEITSGTPDELRLFLKDKLGSRFIPKGTSQ